MKKKVCLNNAGLADDFNKSIHHRSTTLKLIVGLSLNIYKLLKINWRKLIWFYFLNRPECSFAKMLLASMPKCVFHYWLTISNRWHQQKNKVNPNINYLISFLGTFQQSTGSYEAGYFDMNIAPCVTHQRKWFINCGPWGLSLSVEPHRKTQTFNGRSFPQSGQETWSIS